MANQNQYPVTKASFEMINPGTSFIIDDRTAAAEDFPSVSVEVISRDSDPKVLEDAVKQYVQYREDQSDHWDSLTLDPGTNIYSEEQKQRFRDSTESSTRRYLDHGSFLLRVFIGGTDDDSVNSTMRSYYAYCEAIADREEKHNGRVNLWKLRY